MINYCTTRNAFSLLFLGIFAVLGCQSTRRYKAQPLVDDFSSDQFAGLYMQIKWDGEPEQNSQEARDSDFNTLEEEPPFKTRKNKNKNSKKEATIVKVVLENIETGKLVEIFQKVSTNDSELNFWQVPVGPYFLDRMQIEGTNFKTTGSFGYNIYTKAGTLANLGVFHIRPQKNSDRALIVKRKPLIYHQLRSEYGFEGVKLINAYTGKLQRVLARAPQPTTNESQEEDTESNEDIAESLPRERVKINLQLKDRDKTVILTPVEPEATLTAEVSYKVKMKKNSQYAPKIAHVLSDHEDQMQDCYRNQIEEGEPFNGSLHFQFAMHKDQKKLKKLSPSSKNINQKKLNECLLATLRLMEFEEPVTVKGRIEIKFSVK